jgi:hypothetical protein
LTWNMHLNLCALLLILLFFSSCHLIVCLWSDEGIMLAFQRHCKRMGRTRNLGKDASYILIHRLCTYDAYSCGLLCQKKIHENACVPEQVQCHYIIDIDHASGTKNVQMAHQFLSSAFPLLRILFYVGSFGMPFC